MPTTSNFGWTTPADTDLVKDGAAAIRTLGNGIDTSLVDLKGGTTGQILSKASNTDLDYTWITNDVGDITNVAVTSPITGGGSSGSVTIGIDDGTTAQKGAVQLENSTSSTSTTKAATPNSVKSAYDLANAAIPKSLVDAAGDLIYATANDTVARLALGTAGQVLKVNSGATAPEWGAAAAGGAYTLINSGGTTLTGASVTISLSGTYTDLYVVVRDFLPTTNDRSLFMRFNSDSNTRYKNINVDFNYSGVTFDQNYLRVTGRMSNSIADNLAVVYVNDFQNSSTFKICQNYSVQTLYTGAGNIGFSWNVGAYNQTSAITDLVFIEESGSNLAGGTVFVYGVK